METILIFLVFGAICFYAGWKYREIRARQIVGEMMEEYTEQVVDEFKQNVVNIRVEDHEGNFFIYRKDDGSYLAHADSMKKLEDILSEKFPGKMFNASPEDLAKLEAR